MSAITSNASSTTEDWRRYAVLGAIATTAAGTIALTAPFVIMQLRSELPYMATPRRKVIKALRFISDHKKHNNHHASRQPSKFYDLGSGDGEAVLAAASQGWIATGIELNPTLWLVSQLRRLTSSSDIRSRSRFVLGDMFRHDISDARAVMVFGVKPLMPRIAQKISSECNAGTCILSYRFRIPTEGDPKNVSGAKVLNTNYSSSSKGKLDAIMMFDEEEMRVWEMQSQDALRFTEDYQQEKGATMS